MTDKTPLLAQARAAMPGLDVIEAGLAAVNERLRRARAAPVPEASVTEHALAAVLTGQPVPDDIGDRVLAIRRQNEAALAEAQVLATTADRLRYRLRDTHTEQADAALGFLAGELDALLSQARPVLAELGDVDSADAAISASRVPQWRQAGDLTARYAEVRQAQRVISAGAVEPPDQPHRVSGGRVSPAVRDLVDNFGFIRRAHEHFGDVGTAGRPDSQTGETKIIGGRVFTSTLTEQSVHPRPWLTGDTLSDLRFIVRDDVAAWVPSIRELTGARDEHEQRQPEAEREAPDPPTRAISRMTDTRRTLPPASPALLNRLAEDELGCNQWD